MIEFWRKGKACREGEEVFWRGYFWRLNICYFWVFSLTGRWPAGKIQAFERKTFEPVTHPKAVLVQRHVHGGKGDRDVPLY
jgi:hypothetical protein